MPMKPGKEESQSDFMSRCVPEMIGSGEDKRPQEQAVAICLDIWREEHPEDGYRAMIRRQAPSPESDESKDDFMDRCMTSLMGANGDMSEDDAEAMCEVAWGDKSKPVPIIKSTVAPVHDMEFTLSDETVDRYGDIVAADGWQLDHFRKNPVALFAHQQSFPIGTWTNIRVEDKSLRAKLVLASKNASERIREIHTLIEAGILKAVSVGFRALTKPKWIKNEDGDETGGLHFTKHELLECSVVAVPANPNALAIAKSFNVSRDTLALVFAEPGEKRQREPRRASSGEPAATPRSKASAMSISKRIEDARAREVALRDRLAEHLRGQDDSNPSEAEDQVTAELNTLIANTVHRRTTLEAAEKALMPTNGGEPENENENEDERVPGRALVTAGRAALLRATSSVSITRADGSSRQIEVRNRPRRKELDPVDYLVRNGVITLFAHKLKKSADEVRVMLYGEDKATKAAFTIQKAATNPAMTTEPGWAQELVTTIQGDFMSPLMPNAIFPQLSARGLALDFGRAGKIMIPTRERTRTIAGSFVGEGAPIPVRQGLFSAQPLTPKKLGVITVMTREIEEHSIPAIEGLLRDAISEDTGESIDSVLLDSNPATDIRPPGIRNGITPTPPQGATGDFTSNFNRMVMDIRKLRAALIGDTNGNVRAPCFIVNPIRVDGLALTPAPGTGLFPFRENVRGGTLEGWPLFESTIVAEDQMIAVDAADFVTAGQGAPIFEVSDQATLHMEDTNPQNITGGTPSPAVPVRSMWQTDSFALRLLYRVNWLLRRPMVAYMTGLTW